MFSGGAGSAVAAKRVVERYGPDDVLLLFTDTRMEDEDLYRFKADVERKLACRSITITEGRTPWDVFRDERILTSRYDPCSRILKRQMADRYLAAYSDPSATTVYVGIDWTEIHRYDREPGTRGPKDLGGLRQRRAAEGWTYKAPLCEAPYLTKDDMLASLRADGIEPPRLYAMGFAHNNCGGFCIKAGQGHFANLLRVMPERYAYHEAKEEELRAVQGPHAYILRDRKKGEETRPLTLRAFRERIEAGGQCDLLDIGGCGCFIDEDDA
jgi:hypothetical protein